MTALCSASHLAARLSMWAKSFLMTAVRATLCGLPALTSFS